jgi:hypothetical protein
MLNVDGSQTLKRFAAAARRLMEEGVVDADEGRFSKTVFMSATGEVSDLEPAIIQAAASERFSLVMLMFGVTGQAKGPRSLTVALDGEDGPPRLFRDCALVEAEDGRIIAVPRGRGAEGHFAIEPSGLVHRPGRPSALGPGMVRASRRLAAAAREVAVTGPFLAIHA